MFNEDQLIYDSQQNQRMALGLMLSSKAFYFDIRNRLTAEMFTDQEAICAFNAIIQAEKDNVSIDIKSVADRSKELDPLTLMAWVQDYSSVHVNADSLIESLSRDLKKRKVLALTQSLVKIHADKSLDSALIDTLVAEVYEDFVLKSGTSNDVEDITVSNDAIYEERAANTERRLDSIDGLESSFHGLDQIIGGMQQGNLIVIGGTTSIGKTAFALNIAQSVAEKGKRVFIVSLEMNAKENTKRFLSSYAGIPANKITIPSIWELYEASDKVGEVFESVSKLPIKYMCSGDGRSVNVSRIRTAAMAMKARGGLDLIVVDYLQLLDSDSSRPTSEYERISGASRGLKMLAMSLNVPVIALAQLNREATKGQKPALRHFKGSSSIEQDANVGILLHRNKGQSDSGNGEYFDPNLAENETLLIIDKNRNGAAQEEIKLLFNPMTTTFTEKM